MPLTLGNGPPLSYDFDLNLGSETITHNASKRKENTGGPGPYSPQDKAY